NGGTLKYVRVEYAGKKITDGTSEMNGFSFYSVGSGTVLENLVAYKGARSRNGSHGACWRCLVRSRTTNSSWEFS
ncbi:MAG: hypothetical protein ACEQSX_01105, partial [Baekduiaceae bacterium]